MNLSKLAFLAILLLTLPLALATSVTAHTYDLRTRQQVSFGDMLDDLSRAKLVFIGEQHDSLAHHNAQKAIIEGLADRGVRVTIALEMFRQDSQEVLDAWVDGQMDETEFVRHYNDNWGMWPVYRGLFTMARERNIKMIGLNIDRSITRKVSSFGFSALSEDDLAKIPGVACDVDEDYQKYMKRALGGHHKVPPNFQFFCEAQLVWDSVMAVKLIEQSANRPDEVLVVLAGNGHAWKHGIPEQLRRRGELSYRVVLPEVLGRSEFGQIDEQVTDYLLLGVEEALH